MGILQTNNPALFEKKKRFSNEQTCVGQKEDFERSDWLGSQPYVELEKVNTRIIDHAGPRGCLSGPII
jgi:hypothetical protein